MTGVQKLLVLYCKLASLNSIDHILEIHQHVLASYPRRFVHQCLHLQNNLLIQQNAGYLPVNSRLLEVKIAPIAQQRHFFEVFHLFVDVLEATAVLALQNEAIYH